MQSDFEQLYRVLEMPPDCSLDEFQRAYRRRLSAMHPDKGGAWPGSDGDLPLHEFHSLYRRAIAFHAEHGRLPGGRHGTLPRPAALIATTNAIAAQGPSFPEPHARSRRASAPSRWGMLSFSLLVLLPLTLWLVLEGRNPAASAVATAPAPRADATVPAAVDQPATKATAEATAETTAETTAEERGSATVLREGLSIQQVLLAFGPPAAIQGNDWVYGTSWIRFDAGRVSAWYSSPLQPLRPLPRSHPGPSEADRDSPETP